MSAMEMRPTLEELKKLDREKYTVAPVSYEIFSDFITPIEALKILKGVSAHTYMLESAQADQTWGRYTFLGFEPKLEITCIDGKMKVGDISFETDDPTGYLRQILSKYKSPSFDFLPPFTGGLVGYFSYDYLKYSEPTLRTEVRDEEEFKDVDLMLFDKVIAFDNVRQKIVLIVNVKLEELDTEYARAEKDIKALIDVLNSERSKVDYSGKVTGEFKSFFSKEEYCEMVEKGKHHIFEGDIFQIVLSNRIEAPFEGSLLNTYRVLRTINPSPYMFYFSGTDVEVAGASPETLVKLEDGVLHTFPLAG